MPSERTRALYITGQIDRDEAHRQQAKNEEGLIARGGFYSAEARWLDAYVQAVRDAEDARFAIAHRPNNFIVDAENTDHAGATDLGRMYLLAGEVDKALGSLRRATNSCLFAKALYNVHAHAWYGDALAKAGRTREACEQYSYVLERWGHEPRSRTVRAVREAAGRLKCSPPSVRTAVQGPVNQP